NSKKLKKIIFYQAEDGIRDRNVTGVQTYALPILSMRGKAMALKRQLARGAGTLYFTPTQMQQRSLQELQQWCDCYGVGHPLAPSGGWRFSRACLRALEECLAQLR